MSDQNKSFEEMAEEGFSWLDNDLDIHVQSIQDKIDQRVNTSKSNSSNSLKIGAFILLALLLSALIWLVYYNQPVSESQKNKALFATNYEKFPNVIGGVTRSGDDTTASHDSVHLTAKFYELGQLQSALEHQPKNVTLEQKDHLALYQGLTFLELEKKESAIKNLKIAMQSNKKGLAQAGQWYGALTYLQANEVDSSLLILTRISSDNTHYKKDQAAELINALN